MTTKAERSVSVECMCGWRFATLDLAWAEAIMRAHDCENFVLQGHDIKAFELAELELAAETGKGGDR